MLLPVLALIQAVAASPPERIDLLVGGCAPQSRDADEIVVCAPRDGRSPYRIAEQPASTATLPKAEIQLSKGVTAKVEGEQVSIGGQPSNRAMIRLKVRF